MPNFHARRYQFHQGPPTPFDTSDSRLRISPSASSLCTEDTASWTTYRLSHVNRDTLYNPEPVWMTTSATSCTPTTATITPCVKIRPDRTLVHVNPELLGLAMEMTDVLPLRCLHPYPNLYPLQSPRRFRILLRQFLHLYPYMCL